MAGREERTLARASPVSRHQPPGTPHAVFSKNQHLGPEQGGPLTVVLSGYFRLSPRKVKRDGSRPAAWTARRPVSSVLCPGWQGPEASDLEQWTKCVCVCGGGGGVERAVKLEA